MSVVLGLNAFHGDAAAVAVRDGRVVAAVAEERFTRVKHQAGFPERALAWALEEAAGGDWREVDALAVARLPRANLARKVWHALRHPRSLPRALGRVKNLRAVQGIAERVAWTFGAAAAAPRLVSVEHHVAHAASAFFVSPFEEAACLTVDGFGDFVSSLSAVGRGTTLEPFQRVCWPHSVGLFYTALTQHLGFPHYGDEYKVMGLAAHGEPRFAGLLEGVLQLRPGGRYALDLRYFRHVTEGIEMSWEAGAPVLGDVFTPALETLLGPRRNPQDPLEQRHKDLAASVQAVYERALFHLVRHVVARTGLRRLCLAGGCAQNSLANGRLYEECGIEALFVQPAAGDDGTALGAALWVAHAEQGRHRAEPMEHAALGPGFSVDEVERALAALLPGVPADGHAHESLQVARVTDERALVEETARAIAQGEVVGWYQGRGEWGPRALGQRSILADPRRADARELLNVRIKRREPFRPFAPSVLQEALGDWFVDARPDPFMTQVFSVRPDCRARIPAVVHADGTGRVQSVDRRVLPRYAALLDAFREQTGVPMLLNTSFNESEPIVNTPQEALDCFLRTRMDRLVLGNAVVVRSASVLPLAGTS
jgi:carbamoyltransferase